LGDREGGDAWGAVAPESGVALPQPRQAGVAEGGDVVLVCGRVSHTPLIREDVPVPGGCQTQISVSRNGVAQRPAVEVIDPAGPGCCVVVCHGSTQHGTTDKTGAENGRSRPAQV